MLALTTVATVVLELLVHGGGTNTSRHTIQADIQYKTQEEPLQIHECIGAYLRRQDRHKKTTTDTRMHSNCNKIAYTRLHI